MTGARSAVQARKAVHDEEPPTADLIKGITQDASQLVRQEVMLAKQEVVEGLTKAAKASVLLIVGAVIALYGLGFLFHTLAEVLDLFMPRWLAWLIVTILLFAITGIASLLGVKQIKKAKIAPERAQAQLKATTDSLKSEGQVAAEGIKAEVKTELEEMKRRRSG